MGFRASVQGPDNATAASSIVMEPLMKHTFWPALCFALLTGCASATGPRVTLWEGDLVPASAGGVTGTVAAVAQAGRTEVAVEIRQAVPDRTYGWRLTEGTCQNEGALVGGVALYPPMTADPSRTASAEAAVPGELSPGERYAVWVFTGGNGGEQVVACADLVETT